MSEVKKPREFWIFTIAGKGQVVCDAEKLADDLFKYVSPNEGPEKIPVIEKSAYDKAIEALKEMDCYYYYAHPHDDDRTHTVERCPKCRTLKELGAYE